MNEHGLKDMPDLAKSAEAYRGIIAPAGFAARVSQAATGRRQAPAGKWFLAPALAASVALLIFAPWSQNRKELQETAVLYPQLSQLSEVSSWISDERASMSLPAMSEITTLPMLPSLSGLEEEPDIPVQPQSQHLFPSDSLLVTKERTRNNLHIANLPKGVLT